MTSKQRLRGRRRISAVRRSGVVVRCEGVRIRAVGSAELPGRAAIAVVQSRDAVSRNRARRRTKAALRRVLDEHAVDVVVSVPVTVASLPFSDVEAVVQRAVRTAAAAVTQR